MARNIFLVCSCLFFIACTSSRFKANWPKEIAPPVFQSRFETSKGTFDIEVERKWSPKAADRFYQLVKRNYFENTLFYRVNPGFVAQFGGNDTLLSKEWGSYKIPDEPVLLGNDKGTISFARGGKESRSTDLFINLKNNNRLDTIFYNDVTGFPAFGRVVEGMDVVESLYSGYADTTMNSLELMYSDRKAFLKKFPELDRIEKAYIIK